VPLTPSVISRPSVEPWLLDIQAIYHEPAVLEYGRGRNILERFSNAERIVVNSHCKIAGLYGSEGNVADWIAIKRNILVLGIKSSLTARPNTRSSDFVAPSHANGCAMACSYCYVPRRKGYANPISTFVNIADLRLSHAPHRSSGLEARAQPDRSPLLGV
jgi:spore photoproduct lyase